MTNDPEDALIDAIRRYVSASIGCHEATLHQSKEINTSVSFRSMKLSELELFATYAELCKAVRQFRKPNENLPKAFVTTTTELVSYSDQIHGAD